MESIELKISDCACEISILTEVLMTLINDQESNYFDIEENPSILAKYFKQANSRSYLMILIINKMENMVNNLERLSKVMLENANIKEPQKTSDLKKKRCNTRKPDRN